MKMRNVEFPMLSNMWPPNHLTQMSLPLSIVYIHSLNVNVFTRVVVGGKIHVGGKHDAFGTKFHSYPKLTTTFHHGY